VSLKGVLENLNVTIAGAADKDIATVSIVWAPDEVIE
jgi:hypothetical protein